MVQQAQGRVRPTMQMKDGVTVNDDEGLEHEADVMGEKAGDQPISGEQKEHTIPTSSRPAHGEPPVQREGTEESKEKKTDKLMPAEKLDEGGGSGRHGLMFGRKNYHYLRDQLEKYHLAPKDKKQHYLNKIIEVSTKWIESKEDDDSKSKSGGWSTSC